MASQDRSGGGGATGNDAAIALADVLQRMIEDAARLQLQEALHLQEQRTAAALQQMEQQLQQRDEAVRLLLDERMRRMEERVTALEETGGQGGLQGRDEATPALLNSLDERMQRLDVRMAAMDERARSSSGREGSEEAAGQRALELLEGRMGTLEEGVHRALTSVFPRVEALVAQLEEPSPQEASNAPPSVPSTTTTTSSSTSPSTSTPPPPPASALAAPTPQAPLPEAEVRRLVGLRLQEVKAAKQRARERVCPTGQRLCEAAHAGRLESVRQLLENGTDVNYMSYDGTPPLIAPFFYGLQWGSLNPDVVSLLLSSGADVNAINVFGVSALHYAAQRDSSGRCVAMLIGAGADANARDEDGDTPLHFAAMANNVLVVLALLEAGASTELRCWSGVRKSKTPFDVARTNAVRDLLRP